LTKVSLASYFDEGSHFDFIFWWMFHFFLWKMKASHLTSYFDEGFTLWLRISSTKVLLFFRFSLKNEAFTPDFVFWWRFVWLRILTKASYFGFIFWRRLLTLAWYFDEGSTLLTSYFDEGLAIFCFFSEKRSLHT
jgi:hypothetical protein